MVYRWKHRLDEVDVSEDIVVGTLPPKQPSYLKNVIPRNTPFVAGSALSGSVVVTCVSGYSKKLWDASLPRPYT